MRRFVFLSIIASFLFISFHAQTFAQGNLDSPFADQRINIAQLSADKSSENDRVFWDSVKDSKNPDELKAYIEQFPKGVFAPLARARLKALTTEGGQSKDGKMMDSVQTTPEGELDRDGHFIAYDNGTVLDTSTNLMWAAKDNDHIISWAAAKNYCKNYRGGGYTDWRMPTQNELVSLYDKSKSYQVIRNSRSCLVSLTPLIRLSSYELYTSEIEEKWLGDYALTFDFSSGERRRCAITYEEVIRVLPVRSAKKVATANTIARTDFNDVRKQAEQGNAKAQLNLGIMYTLGEGVAKDDVEAVKWFRMAAEQGNAEAQYGIGIRYELGKGVAQDDVEAVKWFRKAAEQGNDWAQFCMGRMYKFGKGVTKDYIEALRWFRMAAEQGNTEAQKFIGRAYERGDGVAKDKDEAQRWFKKALETKSNQSR